MPLIRARSLQSCMRSTLHCTEREEKTEREGKIVHRLIKDGDIVQSNTTHSVILISRSVQNSDLASLGGEAWRDAIRPWTKMALNHCYRGYKCFKLRHIGLFYFSVYSGLCGNISMCFFRLQSIQHL